MIDITTVMTSDDNLDGAKVIADKPWPTTLQYVAAIQRPKDAFQDSSRNRYGVELVDGFLGIFAQGRATKVVVAASVAGGRIPNDVTSRVSQRFVLKLADINAYGDFSIRAGRYRVPCPAVASGWSNRRRWRCRSASRHRICPRRSKRSTPNGVGHSARSS